MILRIRYISKKKFNWIITTFVYIILMDTPSYINCLKQKRQIFRENLLPEKGGKIPESAFHPERLLLNRLNQQGIAVPDGVHLQHRRQEKHPFPKQNLPDTLKVVLMEDGRYVAPPGRYHYPKAPSADTTYVVRMPHKIFHNGNYLNTSPVHFSNVWLNAIQGTTSQYYKQSDIKKWKPPIWYNDISNNKWKNQDITDPSQVLIEFWSYLEKLHSDYD